MQYCTIDSEVLSYIQTVKGENMKKRVFEFLLITFGWVFTVSFCVAIQLSGKSNVLVALMVLGQKNSPA